MIARQSAFSHHFHDIDMREHMILEFLPYVKRIVNRIAVHIPPEVDREELNNVGVLGLIQAIDRYDPSRGNKFTTFAAFRIRGAVLSELRARDCISRSNRRKIREVERVVMQFEKEQGRSPEDHEIAATLHIPLDELHRIKQAASISFISFDEIGGAGGPEAAPSALEFLRDDFDILKNAGLKEIRTALGEAIEGLPQKEKLVISMYYSDEMTMKEIGQALGVTESRVSQLHTQAVLRLRAELRSQELLDDI